ncbi:TspO/MBR family protein [Aestuariivirga sp.]|uniref:TspO/MBR family protein n=1 Tax=Aestuariivirga sp. TaxID=2650926 RepID=UPI0035B3DC3E
MTWTPEFLWPLGVASAVAIVVAIAGAVLTEIGPWYEGLRKPSWKPPDWAFGPVWTTIFVLTVIAAALAWVAAEGTGARPLIFWALTINAVLNIAWSAIFFKMRRPDWALREVALLWLSILGLIAALGSVSALAGILLVPYLVWVSIASFLNLRIVQMNGPFV